MISLAFALLATAVPVQRVDTTVSIAADGRLDLTNARGTVLVRVWDRPDVRIEAGFATSDRLVITRAGKVVSVIAQSHTGAQRPQWLDSAGMRIRTPNSGRPVVAIDYEITIPRALTLMVSGLYTSISVDSTAGTVDIGTYVGDITVRDAAASRMETVAGAIVVERVNGRIDARTLRGDITVRQSTGDVDAKSVNGSVTFFRLGSRRVTGVSYSGDVTYRGALQSRGRYEFSTQSGGLVLHFAPNPDVTIEIAAAPEKVKSCAALPRAAPGPPSIRRYVYGGGSAVLSLDSFEGTVELCFDDVVARE